MPQFNLFANPSAMVEVDQDATTQAGVRKLHFDESM
jgi:hypothetical protein